MSPATANTRRQLRRYGFWLVLVLATTCFFHSGYIQVKAVAAQWLIASAWSKTVANQITAQRPWPWLDTWPVARLQVTHLDVDTIVLDGAQGQSLAFGPGLMRNPFGEQVEWTMPDAVSNEMAGLVVIAGHNDTHFSFVKSLQTGDLVRIQNRIGVWRNYRVATLTTHTVEQGLIQLQPGQFAADDIVLITCSSALQTVLPEQTRLIAHLSPLLVH